MNRWTWTTKAVIAGAVFGWTLAACGSGGGGNTSGLGGTSGGGGGSRGSSSGDDGGGSSGTSGGNNGSSSGSTFGGSSGSGATSSSGGSGTSSSGSSAGGSGASSGASSSGVMGGDAGGGNGLSGCGESLPALSDYSKSGPFQTTTINNTGPSGSYTVVQPMPLGQNGFKHPVAMWGNGITTTPSLYPTLLNLIASNGIVVIASNSTMVAPSDMTSGLDWMIAQNTTSGQYQGMLDTQCLVSIGYSLGGGGAVTAGSHANVVTTVSFHGIQGSSNNLKTPLLLFTSTTDTFVTASGFVTPTYNASVVETFYATLTAAGDPSNQGHLLPVSPTDPEYAPAMAWLRLWVYGDQGGMHYFWGSSATLCQAPWTCESKQAGGASQTSGF